MNTIKYINPRSGEVLRIRVSQMSYSTFCRWWNTNPFGRGNRRPFMAEADERMRRLGFRRAGKRWAGATVKAALRANKIKNALMDSAGLKA